MQKKNIFKALAAAMLMPAMLLTTACSGSEDLADNKPETTEPTEPVAKKGYELPVTINVTRQGDDATRASYTDNGNGTGSLSFSTGDQLFVEGPDNGGAGQFAGTLTWQSGGTFSGTIYTQNPYSGTADELFSAATSIATLLPNGYQSTGFLSINNNSTTGIAYDDEVSAYFNGAFVASETAKATGVEQLSFEQASTYSSGFALTPRCAILNFTISGLEAGAKDVSLQIHRGTYEYTVTGSVTPNASGVATFAIGVPVGANIKEGSNNLTVGTHNFTLPSSTTFAAGKIYNINRAAPVVTNLSSISGAYTASDGETLTGTLGANVKISIAAGATVTLNNVTINGTNNSSYKWAGITCLGNATIILSGTNTVKGFYEDYPGIYVPEGSTVTINGSGLLTASSNGYGAGIGGVYKIDCGNIEIQGGTVEATGGNQAAGIGSGYQAGCGDITISGGTVTATGGSNGAAGIGSGSQAGCGDITITTGVTKVTATKGSGAPNSIGAGNVGTCRTVTIGGTVYPDGVTTSPFTYQP